MYFIFPKISSKDSCFVFAKYIYLAQIFYWPYHLLDDYYYNCIMCYILNIWIERFNVNGEIQSNEH